MLLFFLFIVVFIIIIVFTNSNESDKIKYNNTSSNIGKAMLHSDIMKDLTGRKQDGVEKALTYKYFKDKNK